MSTERIYLFIEHWTKRGMVPMADPIKLERKPDRVWTLLGEHTLHLRWPKPDQPNPIHGVNAFLEDELHDWNWRRGVFHYRSRVADRPIWVLLEYETSES